MQVNPDTHDKTLSSSDFLAKVTHSHDGLLLGCYIHIPFCISKCSYCGFQSHLAEPRLTEDYLKALIGELTMFGSRAGRSIDTVYIGGGTPTILTERQLSDLFSCIHHVLNLSSGAEITIEANPNTIDIGKARHLYSLGVNRVSLGVQSFNDNLLKYLGRTHTARTALKALEDLRQAGFSNISADLIWAVPGQSRDIWRSDLGRILAFGPEHLSLYCLSIEEGTVFYRDLKMGTLHLPSENLELDLYRTALDETSRAGYDHYEISSYARNGFHSRHNCLYWTGQEYYGAGAGAHSFFMKPKPRRMANILNPGEYVQALHHGTSPVSSRETLSEETLLAEALMLSLRLADGVDLERYRTSYGVDPLSYFEDSLSEALRRGWLEKRGGRLRLTPEGILFSNEVFIRLF